MTQSIAQVLPLASPDVAGVLVIMLIMIGVVLVAALLFGGWVIVTIFRAIAGLLAPARRAPAAPAAPGPAPNRVRCRRPNCRADNPGRAQFCRRCGTMLRVPTLHKASMKVAMN